MKGLTSTNSFELKSFLVSDHGLKTTLSIFDEGIEQHVL